MVIPAQARKEAGIKQGDVAQVQPEGDGRILLLRLDPPKSGGHAKVRIVKRKGRHSVAVGDRPISSDQVRALLNELP
jgi:bifunctional DNA-binding transcriptional regulator/antitoxin component of YhaV-PrlF toxin-antitoxin module